MRAIFQQAKDLFAATWRLRINASPFQPLMGEDGEQARCGGRAGCGRAGFGADGPAAWRTGRVVPHRRKQPCQRRDDPPHGAKRGAKKRSRPSREKKRSRPRPSAERPPHCARDIRPLSRFSTLWMRAAGGFDVDAHVCPRDRRGAGDGRAACVDRQRATGRERPDAKEAATEHRLHHLGRPGLEGCRLPRLRHQDAEHRRARRRRRPARAVLRPADVHAHPRGLHDRAISVPVRAPNRRHPVEPHLWTRRPTNGCCRRP